MNEHQNNPSEQPVSLNRQDEDEIDLAQLWGILAAGKWKIAAFVAVALLLSLFYLFVATPVYRADALLQIEQKSSSPLAGVTSEIGQLTGQETSQVAGELEIIRSRLVLGKTAEQRNLDIATQPVSFPIIGRAIARRAQPEPPAEQAVAPEQGDWLSGYAWTPATLNVTRLNLPEHLVGRPLTLRALGGGQFQLLQDENTVLLEGEAGEPVEGETPGGEPISIFVADLMVSSPPTNFRVVKQQWLPTVESLQGRLTVAEEGEQSGIVRISLEGADKAEITQTVNTVAETYLRQNVEARSKEAEQSLEFLNEQLPDLRADLQTAEDKLANYREDNQAVDLDSEGQALLDQIVSLEQKRNELSLKLAELRQTYTGDHPSLQAVEEQMQSLAQERNQLEEEVGNLPGYQKEILSLRRDVEVNTELYTALLNRAQELRIMKAGTVGNVRIVDQAVTPVSAVSPKSAMILMLSLVLGGFLGCGFVFLQAALRRGVSDPNEIENQLGLPVYAVVPFSNWQDRHAQRARRRKMPTPILARDHSDDISVEALRSLRTSLFFAQTEADSNAILVTGPSPGVGKSFVSINLAYLLADAGKSVVVVDADLRRGHIHEFTANRQREPGLSQVLSGQVTLADALQTVGGSNVRILTTGQVPPNPSELLMRESFTQTIEQLKQQFDMVIIDAPPILAVTDAAVIAASIPGVVTFMIARAGQHPIQELETAVNRLSRQGRGISGVVFNSYRQQDARQGGYYSYYQYEYKSRS